MEHNTFNHQEHTATSIRHNRKNQDRAPNKILSTQQGHHQISYLSAGAKCSNRRASLSICCRRMQKYHELKAPFRDENLFFLNRLSEDPSNERSLCLSVFKWEVAHVTQTATGLHQACGKNVSILFHFSLLALRQQCRGNIALIAILPVLGCVDSVQHLQPRCFGGQLPPSPKRGKKELAPTFQQSSDYEASYPPQQQEKSNDLQTLRYPAPRHEASNVNQRYASMMIKYDCLSPCAVDRFLEPFMRGARQ